MSNNNSSNNSISDSLSYRHRDDLISEFTKKPYSRRWRDLSRERNELPVYEYKNTFMRLLDENQTLILVGETGSGKTTQIPQWCLDYCLKKRSKLDKDNTKQLCVACTQPRRVAAMSVAARVADEMDVSIGDEVGYSVRFESCTSSKTLLKYLTDGMLLREAMLDSMLSSYGVIIIDEAHERTLQTEILFGVIKSALNARNSSSFNHQNLPPLKFIIMSATINVKLFKRYLNSPVLSVKGRQHPVQDMFAEVPQSDLLTSTLITVFQIHRTSESGDILVFCSGQDEIQSLITLCKRVLRQAPDSLKNLTPIPLYASLPACKQMRVFQLNNDIDKETTPIKTNGISSTNGNSTSSSASPLYTNGISHNIASFNRRVIFATNVAETSITIPNIKYVVDTGKVKCRTYCPKTGLESLKVTQISKSQANQRSGRAGRIASGTCYRLYTSDEFESMSDHLPPEIKRCNLDGVILQMISIGIKNINSFEFLQRPDDDRIKAAISNLLTLKAIKVSSSKKIVDINVNGQANTAKSATTSSHKIEQNKVQFVTSFEHILNLNYELTNIGKKLCIFPLNPNMSRIILAAHELKCLDEALTIVSLLYIENLFHIPPNKQNLADRMLEKFRSNEGDTIMLLKVYKAFKRTQLLNRSGLKHWCAEHFIHVKNFKLAQLVRKQLQELCKNHGMSSSSCGHDTSIIRRALTYGLFNNVATMWNGKYRNKSIDNIHIHPNSCLFKSRPECILYVEIVETNKCYMRNCTLIDMNWVREISSSNLNQIPVAEQLS